MRECALCHKGSMVAGKRKKLRGNYNPTVKSRRHPNLHKARMPDGKRVIVCSDCLRKMEKTKKQ